MSQHTPANAEPTGARRPCLHADDNDHAAHWLDAGQTCPTTQPATSPRTGGHPAKNVPPAGSPITTHQSSQETTIMSTPSGDANPNPTADTTPGTPVSAFADDEPITAVTADIVLFAYRDETLHVLLVQRGWPPYQGCWALPGGFKETHESPETAAHRELGEETGLSGASLRLVGAYGDPGRDPRGPVVTIAYTALLNTMPTPVAGDDARAAEWRSIFEVLGNPDAVAFDHHRIILDALAIVYARRHREIERTGLLAEIDQLSNALREADAYVDALEKERDDALADADHWREQAGPEQASTEQAGVEESGEVSA